MIVNCCGTCNHGEYNTKKSKTVYCNLSDTQQHQLELCDDYIRDEDKIDRIQTYLRGVR